MELMGNYMGQGLFLESLLFPLILGRLTVSIVIRKFGTNNCVFCSDCIFVSFV